MGQYKSQHTGPQIDAGVDAALNPDVAVTPDSDALVTSGAVADALDNIDPTITSNTDTTLNGIFVGNGSKVGTKSLDTSSLTNDADHVPTSSVVKSALNNAKALSFTVTLAASSWSSNAQTVSNAYFVASGYAYTVCPSASNYTDYADAQIYADDVTTDGSMTFHCASAPTGNLTVNVLRVEVSA